MSEECTNSALNVESPPQKRRRTKVRWEVIQTFPDVDAYKKWMEMKAPAEQVVRGPLQSTEDGDKRIFKCTYSKKRGWHPCPYKLLTFFPRGSTEVEISWNGEAHFHSQLSTDNQLAVSTPSIDAKTRACIEKCVNDGLKPTQILRKLRCEGFLVPTAKQLANCIAYIRKKQGTSGGFTSADLTTWVNLHSEVPSGLDTAFVADHFVTIEGSIAPKAAFGVVITTPRLVRLMGEEPFAKNGCLHTDATYKLLWQGYPVLVAAVSDHNHKTRPVAISVTTNEDGDAFTFLLKALQQTVEKITGHKYCPSVVMADGASAITVAVRRIFGTNCLRGMCWAHTIRNVDKEIDKIADKGAQTEVREGVRLLQLASSENQFQMAASLWYDWLSVREHLLPFRDYFWQQWMGELQGWYEGFSKLHPSTNNGLEAINKTLKASYTLRDRLPLQRFLDKAKEAAEEWSFSLQREGFQNEKTIHLSEWTQAWQWQAEQPNIVQQEGTEIFFVPSASFSGGSNFQQLAHEYFLCFSQSNFGSWENYRRLTTAAWILGYSSNPNGREMLCTCPVFVKKRLCKHSLGFQIMRGDVVAPTQAKTVPLGQKRKRGRPKKASSALVRD